MVCLTGTARLEPGTPVAEVRAGAVATGLCDSCGYLDTAFLEKTADADACAVCGCVVVAPPACGRCGAEKFTQWEVYQGCGTCRASVRQGSGNSRATGSLFLMASLALSTCLTAVNTIVNPALHIVEEPGAVDRLAETAPSDHYYDLLREDLSRRHTKADPLLLDHLVSLEAFLDKSILAGFSFGVDKATVAAQEGKLLGHFVSRSGVRADGQSVQGVRDFAPLREKLHIQQFLGCTNWLRWYLPMEYGQAAKVLGDYQKAGAEFPKEGLGAGSSKGCLAVKAIKKMASNSIELAVFDTAAETDGSCPLEQIADSSGIALGVTGLQMTRDFYRFRVLMTHSKGLTPAQQAWQPLTLEGYAQLEVKRALRKTVGTARTLCWTDHANFPRQEVLEDIVVKQLRWISEIWSDGSELRSL